MKHEYERTNSKGEKETRTYHKWHYGKSQVVTHEFVVKEFVDGPPKEDEASYPFTLTLPDWLPASMILGSEHDKT